METLGFLFLFCLRVPEVSDLVDVSGLIDQPMTTQITHERTTMTTAKHQIMRNVYDVCSLHLLCACDMSVWYTEAGITRHLLDVGRDEGRREGYAAGLAAAKGKGVTRLGEYK